MAILQCYISDDEMELLERVALETGREKTELAEAAISGAISEYFRGRIKINREI